MSVTKFLGIVVRSSFRSLMARMVWGIHKGDNGSQNDLKNEQNKQDLLIEH